MSTPSSPNSHQIKRVPVARTTTARTDDLEVANKLLSQDSQGDKAVLQVIDAPYNGSKPTRRAVFSLSDNIEAGMNNLPPHEKYTARILDVTTHSDFAITGLRDTKGPKKTRPAREFLINWLQKTYTPRSTTQPFEERRIFRWLNDPLLVNDIGSISAQWNQRLGNGNTNLYRLVNRTSLQQDPLDCELHPRDSYLTCAQDVDGKLIGECA